jgi:hypothetical protein
MKTKNTVPAVVPTSSTPAAVVPGGFTLQQPPQLLTEFPTAPSRWKPAPGYTGFNRQLFQLSSSSELTLWRRSTAAKRKLFLH